MISPRDPNRPTASARPAHLRKSPRKRIALAVLSILVGIVVVAAGVFGVLWTVGRNRLLQGQAPNGMIEGVDLDEEGKRLTYQGHTYVYNDRLTTVLFIGTDRKKTSAQQENGANGQADALYLAALDTGTGKVTVLAIPRDIMTDVSIYSVSGLYQGVRKMQVCLAFAYGDGAHTSCENTVQAVSNLLYGVGISTYFCMDWKDISILNDLVGGVTVPEYDEAWQPTGRDVLLSGEALEAYLRNRDKTDLNASINRVERQVAYLKSLAKTVSEQSRQDITVPVRFYNALNSVSINTLDASKITYLTTVFLKGGAQVEFRTLKGEMVQGEEYAEMYLDDVETYEMMLDIFYERVQ